MFRRSSNQSGRGSNNNAMQPQQQRMVMTHDGSHWVQQQPVYMHVGGAYAPHVVSHQVMLTETSHNNNHKMQQQQDYQQQQQQGAARTAYMGHDGMLYYYQAPVQPQPQPQPHERVAVQPQQALPVAASPAEVAARQQRSAAAMGFDRFVDKVKRAFTVDLPGAKATTAPVQQAAPQQAVTQQPQQQPQQQQPQQSQPQQSQPPQPQHQQQQPQHAQTQPQHQPQHHHHSHHQQGPQQQQQQLQQAQSGVPSQQQQQQQVIPAHHQYAHAAATRQEPAVIHRGAAATPPAAPPVGASHHQIERGQPQQQPQPQQPQWQRDQTAAFELELQQLYQRQQQQQQQLLAYQQQQLQMQPSPWAQYELQVQFQDQQQRLTYSQQQEQQELLQRQQVQRYYAAVAAGTAAGGVGITSSTTQHFHIETVRGADGVYRQVYVPDAPLAAPLSPSRPMLEAAKAPATPTPAPTAASAGPAVAQPVAPAASTPAVPAPSVVSATPAPAAALSPAPVAITRPGSPALPPAQPLQHAAPRAPVRAPVQVFGAPLIRRGASLDDCSRQLPSPRAQLNVDESDLPQVLADPLDDSFTTVSPLSSAVSPVVLPRSTRAPLRAPSLPARPIYHRDDAPNGDAWFGTPTKARLPAPDASTPAEPQVLTASGAASSAAAPPAGVHEEVIVAAPVAAPVGHAHYETELGLDGSPSASPRGTRRALEAISREVQLHRELLQAEGSLRVGPRDDDSTPRSVDDLTTNGKVVYEASMRLLFALDSLDGLSAASRIKRKTLVNAVMSLQDDILHP